MFTINGVRFRTDKDSMIGWMSDWSAPLNEDWSTFVEPVPHNSGGLGGVSYRLTEAGHAAATKED